MAEHELMDDARGALAVARELGLEQVALAVQRSRFVEITCRDGEVERIQESTSRSLQATLYLDGRYSSSSTCDLRPDAVRTFLGEARALTALLTPDPHRALPDPALYEGQSDVDLRQLDEGYWARTVDDREREARAIEAAAHADPAVISATGVAYDQVSELALVHSDGFEGQRRASRFYQIAETTVTDEGDRRPSATWWAATCRRDEQPPPAGVGAEALRRALARRGARPLSTRRCPMVVENSVAPRLIGALVGPLSGAALQQNRSFLVDREGRPVGSSQLSLVDDPLLPGGLGSRRFDGEGLAARRRPVFDGGVLRSFFVDTYYGRKLGRPPTTASPSNLVFQPGVRSVAQLLADLGEGIVVTSFLGGNSDPTTGDYSFGIRGHRFAGGALAEPVAEMNITGNLGELWSRLIGAADDPFVHGTTRVPTLAFADEQFSGLG